MSLESKSTRTTMHHSFNRRCWHKKAPNKCIAWKLRDHSGPSNQMRRHRADPPSKETGSEEYTLDQIQGNGYADLDITKVCPEPRHRDTVASVD